MIGCISRSGDCEMGMGMDPIELESICLFVEKTKSFCWWHTLLTDLHFIAVTIIVVILMKDHYDRLTNINTQNY